MWHDNRLFKNYTGYYKRLNFRWTITWYFSLYKSSLDQSSQSWCSFIIQVITNDHVIEKRNAWKHAICEINSSILRMFTIASAPQLVTVNAIAYYSILAVKIKEQRDAQKFTCTHWSIDVCETVDEWFVGFEA